MPNSQPRFSVLLLVGFIPSHSEIKNSEHVKSGAELTTSNVLSTDPRILKFEAPGLELPPYKCTAAPKGPIMPKSNCPNYDIAWGIVNKDVSNVFADLRYLNFILESKDPQEIS
jgi:hypothetical protein